ncbi:SirB2 family protein [Gallaecimonas sp. GXIMD1310]|uniref:SirB2 family protein n=1 Tax=Gallaecimonas sp. GXIMD1310 TaxID=3131926 RepID=UPI0032468C89
MDYLAVKHLHMALAAVTLLLFLWRAVKQLRQPGSLPRWARFVPHIIDTLLLAAGIYLAVQLHLSPMSSSWIAAKIIGLVLYIGFGTFAIKRARSTRGRLLAIAGALLIFAYIVGVAFTKSPWL